MSVAELIGKFNRRHKAALCATLICVGLILLLSHLGIRSVLGIALLGMAFSWALGSNSRLVHWLLFAFGLLLLFNAALDGYYWPKTKAEQIDAQNSIIKGDHTSREIDRDQMQTDRELEAQAIKEGNQEGLRQAGKSYEEDSHRYIVDDPAAIRKDEEELRRLEGKSLLRREVEVDWDSILGGLLLFSSGLGLLIGIRPSVHSSSKTEIGGQSVRIAAVAALLLVPVAFAQNTKPRVFIASNHAWSSTASVTAVSHTAGSATENGSVDSLGNVSVRGTENSTTVGTASEHANGVEYSTTPKLAAELMRTCPGVAVTSDIRNADYVVEFGGSRVGEVAPLYGILRHNASVAVFLPNGDAVLAKSDRTLEGAMQDVCKAIVSASGGQLLPGGLAPRARIALAHESTSDVAGILKKGSSCPGIPITENGSETDYRLTVTRPTGRSNERFSFILMDPNGERISEVWANSLDSALETICPAVEKDIAAHNPKQQRPNLPNSGASGRIETKSVEQRTEVNATNLSSAQATVSLLSSPDSAEIYIDGEFIGNAPATLRLSPGKHLIRVALTGYKDWSREITTLAGSEVHLTANLVN